MTSRIFVARMAVALAVTLTCATHQDSSAQSIADYAASPPNVANVVPPNVLILMDNSGSMAEMAFQAAFDPDTTYSGLFDSAECYRYADPGGGFRFQPDPAANPATPPVGGWTCTGNLLYEWSGNLLNYATMRRMDIVKDAMVGGQCAVPRTADGGCPQSKGQDDFGLLSFLGANDSSSVSAANATGRVPATVLVGLTTVNFHLVGGTFWGKGTFCIDNDATAPSIFSSGCSDGDVYVEGKYTLRMDHLTPKKGVLQKIGNKARFGVMEFAAGSVFGSNGGTIQAEIGSDLNTLLGGIEQVRPSTHTPLAESLYEATRYLAQIAPAYSISNYEHTVTARDPYYFTSPTWASTAGYVECCQSYVILFTDGESTSDQGIPPVLQSYGVAAHGMPLCTGAGCAGHRTDYPSSGSHWLDDVAYWAHTTDIRHGTIGVINEPGKNLANDQKVNVYTFYAFGTVNARELLHTTAKLGAFDDRNGNGVPDNTGQTCTYPAGSPFGTGTSTSSVEWDENADCVADAYFESSNADEIQGQLLSTISKILESSAAGSAASVLASSSTGEGALYQSFFFPTTFEGINEVKWTGYTQGLFLDAFGNMREDTDGNAKLTYGDDKIVRTRFDTSTSTVVVDRYADANGDGLADSATPEQTVSLKEMQPIWEAGASLANTASASRKIITWVDPDGDGVVDVGEQIAFTTANSTKLAPYLRPSAAPFTTDNIINFIRGDQITGMRNRQLTVGGSLKVWKLGDAIHSQPTVVGPPAQRYDLIYGDVSYTAFLNQYKDRRRVAYVGANDGMLHAFNAGFYHRGDDPATGGVTEHGYFTRTPTDNSGGPLLGDELFGFIPKELLPHLRWLAQTDYSHVYYVDLTAKATDARIFTPDADHPNGWGTILMGGFRLGGSCGACTAGSGAPPMTVTADFDNNIVTPDTARTFYSAYFVLDITNPEAAGYPKLLWSFSSADMGLTTNTPSMLRVNLKTDGITSDTNAKWYMVVGSGPTGYDASVAQVGKLFAVDLEAGPGASNSLVTTMAADLTDAYDAFMGTTITIDRNFDYRVDVTYMGSVVHDGSLPWRGKLWRLTKNDCLVAPCSTATWGIDAGGGNRQPTEILNIFPTAGSLELGPIAATPAVAIDDRNKLWVFAGTGRLYDTVDKGSTAQQYFVGVKDSVMNSGCAESTQVGCLDNDLVDVSAAQVCLLGVGDCGQAGGTDQVSGVPGVTDMPSLIALVGGKDGWYMELQGTGERALVRPLVFGGIVLFPTFTPSGDVCQGSGVSTLYVLNYITGGPPATPVIGTTSSGGNDYINKSTSLGVGEASQAVVHVGKSSASGKSRVFVQKSTGEVTSVEFDAGGPITSRYLSWYHARN